ncbi:MAG: undecaprenyl-phosphate glucose phosphotransferase [Muribaculaceae bacterium]|nr:undecaprenyl-phosphate glucose phosphotransferase [Muribaculaceae bacterium]
MIEKGKYGKYLPGLQTIFDFILMNATFLLVTFVFGMADFSERMLTIWTLYAASGLCLLPPCYNTHYRRMLRSELLVKRAIIYAVIHTLGFAAFMTLFRVESIFFGFFAALTVVEAGVLAFTWIAELLALKKLRIIGRNTRNVVIIGTGATAMELTKRLLNDPGYGIRIMGYFDDIRVPGFEGEYMGGIADFERFCVENKIDEVYFTLSSSYDKILNKVIRLADENFIKFYYIPLLNPKLKHQFYMISLNRSISAIGVHPSPLRHPLNQAMKRLFDIVFSTICLVCSPIVFIPIAILIKLDSPGPVFFKQKRTGYMGNEFMCYKFRTMRVNKDADSKQATKNDSRKTRLGDFLRKSSIDELPQFWNVLRGDMSVVGPRPHMLAHTEEYRQLIDKYMVRHLVKPGITGWAQVIGYRGATEELWQMEARVDSDVWYIENWSFLLDMKIMVRTITNAFGGDSNAY